MNLIQQARKLVTKFLPEPSTHDYSRRYWGHDYLISKVIDKGMKLNASGWGHGLAVGDYLILEGSRGPGSTTRYKILDLTYCRDPADMWHAILEFAPRKNPDENG